MTEHQRWLGDEITKAHTSIDPVSAGFGLTAAQGRSACETLASLRFLNCPDEQIFRAVSRNELDAIRQLVTVLEPAVSLNLDGETYWAWLRVREHLRISEVGRRQVHTIIASALGGTDELTHAMSTDEFKEMVLGVVQRNEEILNQLEDM